MQIENMTDDNVKQVSKLIAELQKENPALTSKVYPMEEQPLSNAQVVANLIGGLERKLDFVFGGHVLINGVWTLPSK
jgi:hypothetical protein